MKRQLLLLFISSSLYSQNISTVDYPYQSDIKVFVVDREYKTDLNVFRVKYSYQVKGNEGLWYFVDKQYYKEIIKDYGEVTLDSVTYNFVSIYLDKNIQLNPLTTYKFNNIS